MSDPKKSVRQVLHDIAAADPEAHNRRLARGYGAGPDPVDTEALRKTAYELDGSDFRVVREAGGVLEAAADEVDRLRVHCEYLEGEHEQVKANRDHIIAEYQKLRAVIENAPHDPFCKCHPDWGGAGPCDCWKADAL